MFQKYNLRSLLNFQIRVNKSKKTRIFLNIYYALWLLPLLLVPGVKVNVRNIRITN